MSGPSSGVYCGRWRAASSASARWMTCVSVIPSASARRAVVLRDTADPELPPRVLGLVAEWGALHRFELRRNWTLLATEGKVRRIAPLV